MSENICISNVTKRFEDGFRVEINDLSLLRGRIYGLIGPNGAGKTTSMKCLCGLAKLDSGQILIDDHPMLLGNEETNRMLGTNFIDMEGLIGFTLQEIYDEQKFYFGLSSIPTLESLLQQVELNVETTFYFDNMSLGMKQRFLLVLTFLHNPQVVFLDEPFNGLDPDGHRLFVKLIKHYSQECIIVISSHGLNDLEGFIHAAIFIENGYVKDTKSIETITNTYNGGLSDYYDRQKTIV